MAKPLTVRSTDITRLEGLAQALTDQPAHLRAKTDAYTYIAQHIGVQRRTVQEWVRIVRPMTYRKDTAAAFFDVYERIATLLSEQIYAEVFKMAKAGERDGFKAATWLLPRVNQEQFDPSVQDVEATEDDVFDTAGVSQDVFDAMSDDEREQLAAYRQQVEAAMEGYELLIKRVQLRVSARDLAEQQAGSP